MVKSTHTCEHCGKTGGDYDEIKRHEDIPITEPNIKPLEVYGYSRPTKTGPNLPAFLCQAYTERPNEEHEVGCYGASFTIDRDREEVKAYYPDSIICSDLEERLFELGEEEFSLVIRALEKVNFAHSGIKGGVSALVRGVLKK